MRIKNLTSQISLASNCEIADNFYTRFKGLIGRRSFPEGCGMLIRPCNSIHMFFMKFPLDIVFVDKTNTVVSVLENIKPWQISPIVRNAYYTIELPVGTITGSSTKPGDKLLLSESEER